MELDKEALALEVKRAIHYSVDKNKESIMRLVMRDIGMEIHGYAMQVDNSGLPTHPLARMICVEIQQHVGAQICNQK